ncbi:hypothetical protein KFK09_026253 [Dendrobium nobile]|uniref:Uncharacterized protein n=1 Tax=Dendrobium nobile TaxID=94219 RepID=A0A8T3A712_DENNO|nr:hypothetical protein KFK09_026253 [Dendrobium nobile]
MSSLYFRAFVYMEDECDAEDAICGRRLRVEWMKNCRSNIWLKLKRGSISSVAYLLDQLLYVN